MVLLEEDVEQFSLGPGLSQPVAEIPVAEQCGQPGEQFQVLLGRLFRHQEPEQQVHRLLVDGVKVGGARPVEGGGPGRGGALQLQEGAAGLGDTRYPGVGQGDAVPQPGTAESFPLKQFVEYLGLGKTRRRGGQQSSDLLENALLAGLFFTSADTFGC